MKQKECLNMLMDRIKNNEPVKVDLKNGVILELTFEYNTGLYRAYWREEDLDMGTWNKKVLMQILNGEVPDVEIVL